MPAAVVDEPQVIESNTEYWRAFYELSEARQNGMDPNPIAIAAVQTWCEFHGVAPWRRPMMWQVIRKVDAALHQLQRERSAADKERTA